MHRAAISSRPTINPCAPTSDRARSDLSPAVHGTGMTFDPKTTPSRSLDALKGSAAERAGLHGGDRVVEVAGHPGCAPSVNITLSLSAWRTHTSLTVRTSARRGLTWQSGRSCHDGTLKSGNGVEIHCYRVKSTDCAETRVPPSRTSDRRSKRGVNLNSPLIEVPDRPNTGGDPNARLH
jgi:hypothetical protein